MGIGWGANCAEFSDNDLKEFPINNSDLAPYYFKLSNRIKVSGVANDPLSGHLGLNTNLIPPLDLSVHDKIILNRAQKKKSKLDKLGVFFGKSRMAVRTEKNDSKGCTYCGRCLWGCGFGSIYTPTETIEDCKRYEGFEHYSGWKVNRFKTKGNKLSAAICLNTTNGEKRELTSDNFILAAGAINSGKILLNTLAEDKEYEQGNLEDSILTCSILDTKTIKIPYILPKLIGHTIPERYFQFNKLAIGVINSQYHLYPKFIQGEILSLSSLMYHPLIESLPFGSKFSSSIFSLLHASLGVVTVFCPDTPTQNKKLELSSQGFAIHYREDNYQKSLANEITSKVRRGLTRIGLISPKFNVIKMPSGSGLHYAGTIPMNDKFDSLCVNSNCKSYAYDNLHVVDGSIFPILPSKSLTYTLMANAIRVGEMI